MAKTLYVGDANNIARKVTNIYVGDSNGVARKVIKGYIGDSNNIAREFYSAQSVFPVISGTFLHELGSWWTTPEQVMTMQDIANMQALGATKMNATFTANFVSRKVTMMGRGLAVMASNTPSPSMSTQSAYRIAYSYVEDEGQNYVIGRSYPLTVTGSRLLSATYVNGVYISATNRDYDEGQSITVTGSYQITFE